MEISKLCCWIFSRYFKCIFYNIFNMLWICFDIAFYFIFFQRQTLCKRNEKFWCI